MPYTWSIFMNLSAIGVVRKEILEVLTGAATRIVVAILFS